MGGGIGPLPRLSGLAREEEVPEETAVPTGAGSTSVAALRDAMGEEARASMDIGKQKRVITVEPEPLQVPDTEPAAPEREPEPLPVPEREPERVPAHR